MAVAEQKSRGGARTIVFVDEVHRFNKSQQDAFLPHVEAGHILFIGATTENPSFEVISPLLSRTKVYVLESLTTPQIVELLQRALADKERGLGNERIAIEEKMGGVSRPNGRAARTRCCGGSRRLRMGMRGRRTTLWSCAYGARNRMEWHTAYHRGVAGQCTAAENAAVRQGRRRTLQPDFGAT